MFNLVKKTLTSKHFYKDEYIKIKRVRVYIYVAFLSLLYTVFTFPYNAYFANSTIQNIKSQINNLPKAVEVKVENGELTTNVNNPIVINLNNNSKVVIDSKGNYKEIGNDTTEFIFKSKGFVVYDNGKNIDQNSYIDFVSFNFSISDLQRQLQNLTFLSLLPTLVIIFGLLTFISIYLQIFITAVIFGFLSYAFSKIVNTKITFNQSVKRLLFLSSFFVIGAAFNTVSGGNLPSLGVIFLSLGYLFLANR